MKRVLVSLDELLDTRLGYLASQGNPNVSKWLAKDNHEYFLRLSDKLIWDQLKTDRNGWYHQWKYRDKEILKHSVVSHIPRILTDLLLEYQKSGEDALIDSYSEIHVNTHPYRLTDDEKDEMLDMFSNDIFPFAREVKLVDYSMETLTYDVLKNNYHIIVMYDFNHWLDNHGKAMNEKKLAMASTMILTARLFTRDFDLDKEVKNPAQRQEILELIKKDPFKLMEAALAYRFQLRHIPAPDFGPVLRAPYKQSHPVEDIVSLASQLDQKIDHSWSADPLFQFLQERGILQEEPQQKE